MPAVPFKLNQDRRHHIPRKRHKVANWREYDASLRQRGSLTVWFTDEAVAAWAAEPRTTRGGQPWYSALAILTALTLRAVFRLAYRQTEGLIGSVIDLLGLALRVPDHTTLSRRAATLEVPRPRSGSAGAGADSEPVHLLVDSTGLKLCGAGEWLLEKHGTRTRRSWRKLHVGVDADTGRIVAAALTTNDVDDGALAGPLLDRVAGPVASFTADGAYDQDRVYAGVAARHPEAGVGVPPRAPPRGGRGRPAARDRRAQRDGRGRADTARPPSPAHRRARAHGLAESVRVHETSPGRGRHRQVETGDRRRVARACGPASGDRGGCRRPRPQPHVGARTPELRPHRLTPGGVGVSAPAPLIRAPCCRRAFLRKWRLKCRAVAD